MPSCWPPRAETRRRSASCTTATPSACTAITCAAARRPCGARPDRRDVRAVVAVPRPLRRPPGGSAGPWLFGIARHVLLMSVRSRRLERAACQRLGVLERLDTEPSTAEPDERWLDGLDEALAGLTDDQRRAIELRVVDGLEYDRVAEDAGMTPEAARARVSRGLAALRHRFTDSQGASTMTDLTPELERLGDALEGAVAAHAEPARPRPPAAAVAALLIAVAVARHRRPRRCLRGRAADLERGRRRQHAGGHAGPGRHPAVLHGRHRGRRVPLHAGQGARARRCRTGRAPSSPPSARTSA